MLIKFFRHNHRAITSLHGSGAVLRLLHQRDRDAAPYYCRRPLQARQRDIVFRIKQPVNLRAARLEQHGHLLLRNFPFLHGLRELPRDDLLDRLRLRLFKDTLFFEEIVNTRTHMFLAHCSSSFLRFRANARSSSGVARVFLINPCSATRCRGKGRAARAPYVSSAGSSGFPTARFPTAGITASPPATATARAIGPSLSPGARLPAIPSATPARARCPPPRAHISAELFAAVGLLPSCTLYKKVYLKMYIAA